MLIDKPEGLTSHDVVAQVRRKLGFKQVGHAGTLDPLATGLLVVLLGEATKISDYLLLADKAYQVKVQLGIETDSLDITGQVIKQIPCELNPEYVSEVAAKLVGALELPVPQFSAVKVNGKKLYEDAHKGEESEVIPMREMEFHKVRVIETTTGTATAQLFCQKGAYVRSWAAELGKQLEVGGAVATLRRIQSAPFNVDQASLLEELPEDIDDPVKLREKLNGLEGFVALEDCLTSWTAVTLLGRDETLMRNGQVPKALSQRLVFEQKQANKLDEPVGVRVLSGSTGELICLLEAQPCKGLKVRRIFNSHKVPGAKSVRGA